MAAKVKDSNETGDEKSVDEDSEPALANSVDDSNDKIVMSDLSPPDTNNVDKLDENTKETKDKPMIVKDDDECEVIPDEAEKKSSESNKTSINGANDKSNTNIEIVNLHDDKKSDSDESDSEIQIINPEEEIAKKTADLFKSTSDDTHYTLTAGFSYYNSLKEKICEFKAGDYKPVKFPLTGTLLLAENEVIIESPSLLVPLLLKESDQFPKLEGDEKKINGDGSVLPSKPNISKRNFFQSSVGQFFINLGMSRVQEWYQRDMIRLKLKQLKTSKVKDLELEDAVKVHEKKLEELKEINAAFNFHLYKCKTCEFKTESLIVMEGHNLIPHISPQRDYKCSFCDFQTKDPSGIAHYSKILIIESHYSAIHSKKIIIDNNIPFHECIFCTFQSHSKDKVNAHMNLCRKHFIPSQNLSPPFDFEFPGVTSKPFTMGQDLMKHIMAPQTRMSLSGSNLQLPPGSVITRPRGQVPPVRGPVGRFQGPRGIANIRTITPRRGPPYTTNFTSAASQLASSGISITPVTRPNSGAPRTNAQPRAKNVTLTPISTNMAGSGPMLGQPRLPTGVHLRPLRPAPPYQLLNTSPSQVVEGSSGNTCVVCEICDSYIKDLEELRTHMIWVHKVKIHPMLVSRPPLNCQKCHRHFFTDHGLERHLLGAHGLVTTNMHEMANKNQDSGRCILCGAVFIYKLVSHTTQVHKVTLKPYNLFYKCTDCTTTFTSYRLFESHVYDVHSGSAKKSSDENSSSGAAATPEPTSKKLAIEDTGPRKCRDCSIVTENMHDHLVKVHIKDCSIKLCRIEKCEKCLYSSDEMLVIRMSDFRLDDELDDSDEDSSEEDSDDETADSSSVKEEETKTIAETGDNDKAESDNEITTQGEKVNQSDTPPPMVTNEEESGTQSKDGGSITLGTPVQQ